MRPNVLFSSLKRKAQGRATLPASRAMARLMPINNSMAFKSHWPFTSETTLPSAVPNRKPTPLSKRCV